jgi:hypothetical protein
MTDGTRIAMRTVADITLGMWFAVLLFWLWQAHRTNITYETDTGKLISFHGDWSLCESTQDSLSAGLEVSTVAPWGERFKVRRIACGAGGLK